NSKLPTGIQNRDSGGFLDVAPATDLANAIINYNDCTVPQNRTTVAIEDVDVVDDELLFGPLLRRGAGKQGKD
ncbi:MAG TPA: hypothetical protein VMT78_02280, partial [Terriglobia bacterium]|nr:hypothetical protein [Terriglobia bacterium]